MNLRGVRWVRVGSTNAPKVEAARAAVRAFASGASVEGIEVSSGVSEQPVGFEEIVRGACNRARAAQSGGACDLGVGLEDGLVVHRFPDLEPARWVLNVGCAAVTDGTRMSLGFSSAFAYPPACSETAVSAREPIGELFDRLWAARRDEVDAGPSGRGVGNIGKLTAGVLPRAEYARHAVLCALVRFLQPDLYEDEPAPADAPPRVLAGGAAERERS